MNKPTAWKVIETDDEGSFTTFTEVEPVWTDNAIPLYTHPAKTQSHTETAVKILSYLGYAQEPSKEEGADARRDKLVEIISQSHSAKTLTDEEIDDALSAAFNRGAMFGYAEGLKKASEK